MKKLIKLFSIALAVLAISCDDEPVDLTTLSADDAITVNSELYNNIERVTDENPDNNLVCIDFIYAFAVNIFDENLEFVGTQIIASDLEFSAFLGSLQESYSISMSYPITSTTDDGQLVQINNNDELKEVIDDCLKEETLGYCNGLLTEPDCVWEVIENDEGNTDYEHAYFDVSDTGETSFFFEENVYFGTWITFFIEDELHININLNDDSEVANDWNIDWKVTIVDENNMILNTEGRTFFITKICNITEECNAIEFEECELNEGEGIAEFVLEEYVECVTNYIDYETTETTVVSFHESQVDAEANTNAIGTSPFLNTVNPQSLYLRIEETATGETIYTSIQLIAGTCD